MRFLAGSVTFNRSHKWTDYSPGPGFIRNLLRGECITLKVLSSIKTDYIGRIRKGILLDVGMFSNN